MSERKPMTIEDALTTIVLLRGQLIALEAKLANMTLDTQMDVQRMEQANTLIAILQAKLAQEQHQSGVYQKELGIQCHARSVAEAKWGEWMVKACEERFDKQAAEAKLAVVEREKDQLKLHIAGEKALDKGMQSILQHNLQKAEAKLAQAEQEVRHWREAAQSVGETDGHGWAESTKEYQSRLATLEQTNVALDTERTGYRLRSEKLEAKVVDLENQLVAMLKNFLEA